MERFITQAEVLEKPASFLFSDGGAPTALSKIFYDSASHLYKKVKSCEVVEIQTHQVFEVT